MRKQIASLAVVGVCLVFASAGAAQETCCASTAGTLPIPMPPGQTAYDYSGMIVNAFLSPMMDPKLTDCPRPVDIMSYRGSRELNRLVDAIGKTCGVRPDPQAARIRAEMHGFDVDYLFIGTLTAADAIVIDGYLYGIFTLKMKLIDNCPEKGRSGTVLREGEATWDGSNTQIAGEGGIICRVGLAAIKALGQSFMPLDDLIHDYERVPEDCEIRPEKEPVKVGEKVTIYLENIKDGQGRAPQPWQQLLVKAEEGTILNGTENGDYRRFAVNGGKIAVEYKAPTECPDDKKDTIIVKNSCECCLATRMNVIPDHEIAKRETEIECEAELEIDSCLVCGSPGGDEYTEEWERGRVPFFIEGTTIKMVDEPAELEITTFGHVAYAGCVTQMTGGGTTKVTISGDLVINQHGQPELHITYKVIERATTIVGDISCPTRRAHTVFDFVSGPFTDNYTIPYEDGHKLEEKGPPDPSCTSTWSLILHLNE